MIDIYLKKQIFIFIPYNKSYQPFFVVFGDNCQLSVFVLYKFINSFIFIALIGTLCILNAIKSLNDDFCCVKREKIIAL